MKLTIYGAGYVGLVTGICMAELGHNVCVVDVDKVKIANLKQGQLPIYEENLQRLLEKNTAAGRLSFTTDFVEAVGFAALQMIAVGTPAKADGSADLQYVDAVASKIGELMNDYCCVVNKSTVPVGTAQRVANKIQAALDARAEQLDVDVVSNPEFLREGRAVKDCMAPDRIVVGLSSARAESIMRELYQPLTSQDYPLIIMDAASAELTKYAANAFLATKISFINEISQIAEKTGANIHAIKEGIGLDSRINAQFLNAGCGFGGSCFPKDVSALQSMAQDHGYEPHMLNAVLKTNANMQQLLFDKISRHFNGDLQGKTIALWGLAFKPNTDDVRCASSRVIMEALWQAGATVQAYDPLAAGHIQKLYPNESQLTLCDSAAAALNNADVLAVVTEWDEFKDPDFTQLKQSLKSHALFDGRNLYMAEAVRAAGLDYYGVGC